MNTTHHIYPSSPFTRHHSWLNSHIHTWPVSSNNLRYQREVKSSFMLETPCLQLSDTSPASSSVNRRRLCLITTRTNRNNMYRRVASYKPHSTHVVYAHPMLLKKFQWEVTVYSNPFDMARVLDVCTKSQYKCPVTSVIRLLSPVPKANTSRQRRTSAQGRCHCKRGGRVVTSSVYIPVRLELLVSWPNSASSITCRRDNTSQTNLWM